MLASGRVRLLSVAVSMLLAAVRGRSTIDAAVVENLRPEPHYGVVGAAAGFIAGLAVRLPVAAL